MTRRPWLIAFAAAATVAGCHCQPTGLFVTVSWDGGVLQPTQLLFTGTDLTRSTVFFDASRPDTPSTSELQNPSTVLVQLDDSLNGDTVDVHVEGFQGGVAAASGDTLATVASGSTTNVFVALGVSVAGGDGGCSPASCEGCCDGITCRATDAGMLCRDNTGVCHEVDAGAACSIAGTCHFCLPGSADSCSGAGACSCGTNAFCADTSDTCDGGQCFCGSQLPCPPSEICLNGQCVCGNAGTCGAGQQCKNGECVCDSTTGCSGCCEVTVQAPG